MSNVSAGSERKFKVGDEVVVVGRDLARSTSNRVVASAGPKWATIATATGHPRSTRYSQSDGRSDDDHTGCTRLMHVKEYEAALAEMKATEDLRKLGLDLRWHVARDPKLTPVAVLAAIQAILATR